MTIDRGLGRLLPYQLPNHFKSHPFNEKFFFILNITFLLFLRILSLFSN